MLEYAMVAGFARGVDAFILLAPFPPRLSRCSPARSALMCGVMISASHNPYQDNGIKLFGPDGYKLSDEIEKEIEEMLDQDLSPAFCSARRYRSREAY